MLLKVTAIEFDFSTDSDEEFVIPESEQYEIKNNVMKKVWHVYEEEELANVISDETGWCIKSLSFDTVFS